jgi:hypothetical protein
MNEYISFLAVVIVSHERHIALHQDGRNDQPSSLLDLLGNRPEVSVVRSGASVWILRHGQHNLSRSIKARCARRFYGCMNYSFVPSTVLSRTPFDCWQGATREFYT